MRHSEIWLNRMKTVSGNITLCELTCVHTHACMYMSLDVSIYVYVYMCVYKCMFYLKYMSLLKMF